ncbi:MAG: bacteriohemerythrin [Gammaproteobacteria bacterium]|nr:bacteriohemerythrin [Gammaproteobacteria bacterium]MDH3749329.1 bacteriohemerythrin [Gammaproteobacteria bacterium]MDH3804988.1 bacteriohemerythrin [Gammaproteobacteria bacterium]
MSLLQWKDEFKVGVAEVDHEHEQLIGLINELHKTMQASGDFEQILDSLGEIYAQISAHFALEERMMRKSHYPAYAEHKEDHETLLDDLRDIMDDVEDDGIFDETQLSIDLNRWFSDHFRTHDAKLHQSGHG